MGKTKCNNDIKLLSDFLHYKSKYKIESEITDFNNIERIYKWTNEHIRLYPNDSLEGKKVLTITASGDQALEAILCGAKEIDSIDINVFSKYFSALKIAMIKRYDYDEFFKKIELFTNYLMGEENLLKYDILDEISKFLNESEISFWKHYLKESILNPFELTFSGDCMHNGPSKVLLNSPELFFDGDFIYNRYCDKELYLHLKNNLYGTNIKYYDGDIAKIDQTVNKKTYDYMYLSNIIERIDPCLQDKWKLRKETVENLIKHLNKNGSIYNYFLGLEGIKIKDKFGPQTDYLNELFSLEYYCDYDVKNSDCGVIKMTLK